MVEAIVRKCDLNNDGLINFQEFVQAAIDHSAILNEDNIKIAFSIFDQDKDGKISLDELKQVITRSTGSFIVNPNVNFTPSTMNMTPVQATSNVDELLQNVMMSVDKDGDNMISFKEFNSALTNILKTSARKNEKARRTQWLNLPPKDDWSQNLMQT